MSSRIHGLYAIVDPQFLPTSLAAGDYVRMLLDGGCRLLQLRCKGNAANIYDVARDVLALKRHHDFTCIINDDVVCAKELRADGVHLGQDDVSIADARALLGPQALIGYSSHALPEAQAAEVRGADYVAFGAIYQTATKGPGHPVQGIERLREVVHALSVPVVAIGGITRERTHDVAATGVSAVAMITGLSRAVDPRAEATWYIQQLSR